MGKKKRKDLIKENLTNTDVTNTDVGFGEMAIQQTITNCSDIGKNTDAIVERIGAKLDHLIEWFTTQKRIDELNAELKMLDEQCASLFPPYDAIAYDAVDSRLRCKRDLRELEDEQRRLRREQERRGREEQERRGREEQERREHEARKNLLQRAKDRDGFLRNTWLGGKWNTPYGIYVFIATEIDSGFYGQNDKTPFLCVGVS